MNRDSHVKPDNIDNVPAVPVRKELDDGRAVANGPVGPAMAGPIIVLVIFIFLI